MVKEFKEQTDQGIERAKKKTVKRTKNTLNELYVNALGVYMNYIKSTKIEVSNK